MKTVENRDFTLIDAFNQFWQVWENTDKRSLTCMGLYFYLCKVWNACGRPNVFRRQNKLALAELSISKPTLINNRNWLKQSGLIDFHSKGKGDENINYEIIDIRAEVKKLYSRTEPGEVKKEKNLTSRFTSSFTSSDDIKQSTENSTFIIIDGEVKNFYYMQEKFLADEGLQMRWWDFGFKNFPFEDGVTSFMQLKHGTEYPDYKNARDNFFHWIPNYSQELKKRSKNESNRRDAASGDAANSNGKPGTGQARTEAIKNF